MLRDALAETRTPQHDNSRGFVTVRSTSVEPALRFSKGLEPLIHIPLRRLVPLLRSANVPLIAA